MADNSFDNEMIPYVEFADNANERTPCVLVLDCSGSMRGEPIKQLNAGLKALEKELKDDIDASSRVQLLIIKAFGKDEAVVSSDWIDAMNFEAPEMEAGGLTPLGKAMELALQKSKNKNASTTAAALLPNVRGFFLSATANRPIMTGRLSRKNAVMPSKTKKWSFMPWARRVQTSKNWQNSRLSALSASPA